MSLINFIQKIQSKPRYIRIQILWLSVFVSMFFIVGFWLVSLKYSLPVVKEKTTTAQEISQPMEQIKEEIPSLKEAFKASIGAFFEKDLEEEFEELDKKIESGNHEVQDIQVREKEKIKPAKLPLSS